MRWPRDLVRWPIVLSASILLSAQPVSAQELPVADDLIRRYVEAIGGREAHLAPTSIRTRGSVSIAGLGIEGEFELLQILPDRMLFRVTIAGFGEQVQGYDGEIGWSVDPLVGPMVLAGDELAGARERAHALASLRDPEFVTATETLQLSEMGGEACWRVRLQWTSGRETFDCFSVETGLLVASEDVQLSSMGQLPVTTLLSDYRPFAQMLLPTRIVQLALGQEQRTTVASVEVNTVAPTEIQPPDAVRTLLGTGAR